MTSWGSLPLFLTPLLSLLSFGNSPGQGLYESHLQYTFSTSQDTQEETQLLGSCVGSRCCKTHHTSAKLTRHVTPVSACLTSSLKLGPQKGPEQWAAIDKFTNCLQVTVRLIFSYKLKQKLIEIHKKKQQEKTKIPQFWKIFLVNRKKTSIVGTPHLPGRERHRENHPWSWFHGVPKSPAG